MPQFDPSYGYTLDQLKRIEPPPPPDDFVPFWQKRYQRALSLEPYQRLTRCGWSHPSFECYDLNYRSTDAFEIWGWALVPKHAQVTRGVIVGHGYGGREGPDFHLPIPNAVFLFPCFRGLSRSRRWPISDNPAYHVLHDIDKKDRYILGGCVEDLWVAVSALLALFPSVAGHIAYLGISFGGGIGALALPWDRRIQRAHFNVPSFGHHPLRLKLPTWGSAASLQNYQSQHSHILDILRYYDAAVAARFIEAPVHVAAALADPVVAPPGQFSIYNALPREKRLFVLERGHAEYPRKAAQENELIAELGEFFSGL
ncbi:acetylxylan esterase [Methylomicrobium sp. Wu6]|uniref:acetylxylan esterase n=1 Tax=Methylomicrobium sp. Wu6 TaxID=3107928 RepID=UPI002DD64C49|nr:acetylxylan esterase [Methylomicrobium sp. Wu6]MEC4747206.1 acetylxylan esterase [Methylomicrobium sp. Wu6]